MSLGLFNTYDPKRLHEIHIRTIARAAAVCYAFDFNLILVGFPFKNFREEIVNIRTTIGKEGEYIRIMLNRNKILHVDYPNNWFPAHMGEIIVATPDPEDEKRVNELDILKLSKKKNLCILIGLGRKGLPKKIIRKAKYHYEITGRNVELETCTVIGIIPAIFYKIKTLLEYLKKVPL